MRICIDGGHNYSGYDTGVVNANGVREQDITFDIAFWLKNVLVDNGHEVILTRTYKEENLGTSVDSSLQERVNISNKNNCDFFISIHCNSGPSSATGTEVLIAGRGGKAEEYATKVCDAICRRLDMTNRGVRVDTEYLKKRLCVLHNTNCPAILVEAGFLTNIKDAIKLTGTTREFSEAIATAFGSGGGNMSKFSDVIGHWAEKHIEKLAEYGIVNGFEDGQFKPDEPVTRAQASVMIANVLSILGK